MKGMGQGGGGQRGAWVGVGEGGVYLDSFWNS